MRLLSWNVQWCRGLDGVVDPARIAAEARRIDPDVICLQELAANFPELEGSRGEDQPHALLHNLPPGDPLHERILEIGFVDAWQALNPGKPHPNTFRVHERDEGESPYCCDYVFVTADLAPRLRSIRVEGDNRASDHQPVIVELG